MKKILLALIFGQVFISCEKNDENDDTVKPYLHFYESKISIPPFISGSAAFVVESNIDWELSVTSGAEWLQLSKKSGHGTDTIHVDVIGQNVGSQTRTATVIAKVTDSTLDLQAQLTVEQKPYNMEVLLNKRLEGTLSNYFNAIVPGSDGGYLAVGSNNFTGFPGVGFGDAWMVKFNKSGDTVWTRTMGKASMDDVAKAAIPTSDGGFIVAAETVGNNSGIPGSNDGAFDWWLIKLNSNGDTAWTRLVGTNNNEYVSSIVPASNGNFIVVGSRHITGVSGNALVARFDQNGNKIWEKNFDGFGQSIARSVSVSPNGSVYVAIWANNNTYNYDYRIIKLDANGEQIWSKGFGSGSEDDPGSIQSTIDGGCIVAGTTYGSENGDVTGKNHGSADLWVMKLNASGDITWNKLLGGSSHDAYGNSGIALTPDGGYVLVGYAGSSDGDVGPDNSTGGAWALKLNNGGQLVWSRVFGATGYGDPRGFTMGSDGSFWVAGTIASSGGLTDGWIMNFKVN